MKRIISLILALMMVCTVLVSCVQSTENPDETTASNADQTTGTTDSGKTYNLFDPTNMKARHEWEEKIMHVLCWNSEHKEFEVTEDQIAVDELHASIFERDNQVKAKLGITAIQYNEQIASAGNEENFAKYVERVATNGDAEVDIIAAYARTEGLVSQKGYLVPLNFYDKYIDLSNPWYPEALVEEIAVKDNIYFISGDISTNLLYLTYGFIFNKELMDSLNIDYNELYTLAEEGKWTYEEMYKLTEYYNDANGNGKKDDNDGYGMRCYGFMCEAYYTGAGLKLVNVNNKAENPEDLIKISEDYGSSKSIDLSDSLGAFFTSDYGYTGSSSVPSLFASTRGTISMVTRIRDIKQTMTLEKKLPVGVLPMPKYDLGQEDYKCVAGNPFTLWGIFSGNMDLEREESAAGFIEYMGYYGMENTTEAVFADTFLARYSDQPDDANSFNTIRRTTSFDMGRIFAVVLSTTSVMADQWANCTSSGSKWAAIFASCYRSYATNARTASKDFWKLATETFKNPYEYPYE